MNTEKPNTNANSSEILITSNFWSLSKKLIKGQAQMMMEKAGDPMQAYAAAMRLSELANQIKAMSKAECLSNLEDEPVQVGGGEMSWRGGGFQYRGAASFGHYSEWQEAKARLEEIEGMMKAADKIGAVVIDKTTGEEVPRAKPVKVAPSLIYKY